MSDFMAPRPVTRGESPKGQQVAKIDWLNCTFAEPAMSVEGFVSLLGRMLGRPVSGIADRGMLGFDSSVKLFARHGSLTSPIGCIAFGGESQRGRWLFQLTGGGCQFVRDWAGLRDLLESLDAKLTRVDLAVDFLEGEHTVEEAVTLYQTGGFQLSGRPPSSRLDGDWINGHQGRTLYIGKAQNGKMLRVYEKGRQLGDPDSQWTRFEVQLGSRDRVIPFDVLTDRDAFFAGCYPALASFIDEAAEAIPTLTKGGEVTLAHLVYHAKRCYGKLFGTLLEQTNATNADLVEEVRIVGIPRRVNLSSLAAGVTWADVQAQHQKVSL
ncbi:phage replication initiation protein [Acidovorax sp. 107]|nr:phage replication initiation protein [Acidovorax sp. 107]